MDIDTIQKYVTLIKDIVTGASALVAAIVAIKGLQTWKKQLKGKTEYEVAQKLLRATYAVREAFAYVRNPFQSSDEIAQAMQEANIEGDSREDPRLQAQTEIAVYQRRWQKVQNAFVELESILLEAEAIWGESVRENIRPLQKCKVTLYRNIKSYLRRIKKSPLNIDEESQEKIDDIIFGWGEDFDDNVFSNEIRMAVAKMEDFLRPRLKM